MREERDVNSGSSLIPHPSSLVRVSGAAGRRQSQQNEAGCVASAASVQQGDAKVKGSIRGDRYFVDGTEVTKAVFDQLIPDLGAPLCRACNRRKVAVTVRYSDALAVHPSQIKEAT